MAKTMGFEREVAAIKTITGKDPIIITCKECELKSPAAPGSRAERESICWACLTFPGCKGDFAAGFFEDSPLMKHLRKSEESE